MNTSSTETNQEYCIYALHGFLGAPADWSALKLSPSIKAVNLSKHSGSSLKDWARSFNHFVEQQGHKRNILAGYSLGGRLALHVLLDNPTLWQQAILISAHPGLTTAQERKDRLRHDHEWAKRFEQEAWSTLMTDWNNQSVFKSGYHPERKESDYDRAELARQLREWSTGHQEDLREQISTLLMPMLWIAGEKDQKYLECMQTLSFKHPHSQIRIIPEVGHRVLWEASGVLYQIFNTLKY